MNSKDNMTAVEWLVEQMRLRRDEGLSLSFYDLEMFAKKAKQMEKEEIHKRQLMLGKVSELIGFEKTVELWKECIETFENKNHETE